MVRSPRPSEHEITIAPVTRIEGHAKVTIRLDREGSVKDARFQVIDFRGFEKFCEGRPFYEMPSITSRICGICPVSHLLASVKACDDILAVTIPQTAVLLRRLMHMGQIIQSHALSFFYLSSPDILLGMDAEPAKRNIFYMMEKYPQIARDGIKLRKFGQEIIESLSGRRIHSSEWVVPGGVSSPLKREKAEAIQRDLPEALRIVSETLSNFKERLEILDEEIESFGNFPTYYLGMVTQNGEIEHYDGPLRIVDPNGSVVEDNIDPKDYAKYIGEAVEPWTYMKVPYLKLVGYPDGIYRVGPLPRLNISSRCGTPLADAELKEYRKFGRNGIVQSTFMYHYARLLEILFCIEKVDEILKDPATHSDHVQAKASANRMEGIGVAEAPRGTLIHHYRISREGLITWANLIIATEHNNLAYNKAIAQVAKKYIRRGRLDEGLLNRIEAVIRALDPCLSCATHEVGRMPLQVKLVDDEGHILDQISR
ncbi:MAG: Ni/Fe hydrogenase subunit alpha [Nitrososphaerota archaeon]|nr:Ni/Fe hydrogenase subunit alpha [Nitrososphaerota archaeon]